MLNERDYMRHVSHLKNPFEPPPPINITKLNAQIMVIKNLLLCTGDELQDLLNENSALLADEGNGTYEVWEERIGRR